VEDEKNNMKICLPATISQIRTMSDNTIRVQLDLQETSPENITSIFEEKSKLGYFLFHPSFFNEIDTSKLPPLILDEDEKSPAQRLRNVLFILHKQNKGEDHDFDAYYRKSIERVIETIKEKLI